MKATGIVRRIDDLGRVVIPKEIRRTLRIREGDPLEIYTNNDGGVVFKKYSPVGELSASVTEYAEVLAKMTSFPTLICDRDHVVAVAGISKKEFLGRRLSQMLEDLMENRKSFVAKKGGTAKFQAIEGINHPAVVAFTILSSGDITGAVILLSGEAGTMSETEIKLAQMAAEFLGKQVE